MRHRLHRGGRSAGPWRPATDDPLLRPSADAEAFDHAVVTNPRMEYLNGKWFMYYKARKFQTNLAPHIGVLWDLWEYP